MSVVSTRAASRMGVPIAFAVLLLFGLAPAVAQETDSRPPLAEGRIDFDAADLPPANVEIDLNHEVFGDLFGLGDAALAGVLESLGQANQSDSSRVTEIAESRLAAAREVLHLAKAVVREVRVRVYEDLPEGQEDAGQKIADSFEKQLQAGNWDRVLKVRENDESVRVAVMRGEGSVLGVFVTVVDGDELVLANVVCQASPENVKKLAAAATKIGLENGLRDILDRELRHLAK